MNARFLPYDQRMHFEGNQQADKSATHVQRIYRGQQARKQMSGWRYVIFFIKMKFEQACRMCARRQEVQDVRQAVADGYHTARKSLSGEKAIQVRAAVADGYHAARARVSSFGRDGD